MEKIYMDDNNSPKKQGNGQYHFSIVLSFAVAIFAIVSLIAVGFNQVSYAAPNDEYNETVTANNDTFKLYYKKNNGNPVRVVSYIAGDSNSNVIFYEPMFSVENYNGDYNTVVFCVGNQGNENDNQGDLPGFDKVYSYKENQILGEDEKNLKIVNYILKHSGIYNSNYSISGVNRNNENFDLIEAYATQMTIWVALGRKVYIDNVYYTFDINNLSEAKEHLKANKYQLQTLTSSQPVYTDISNVDISDKIISAVKAALNNYNNSDVMDLSVNLDDEVSEVDGKNEYQSSLVSVSGEGLETFSLTISGVDGAYLVDENGNTIENFEDIDASTKFYVRFPKDSLKEDKTDIVIKATGKFTTFEPVLYNVSDGNYQEVVKIGLKQITNDASNTLTVVKAPDTASSVSQTIYFIGLVVLLCGVGIIYANSKAIKNS